MKKYIPKKKNKRKNSTKPHENKEWHEYNEEVATELKRLMPGWENKKEWFEWATAFVNGKRRDKTDCFVTMTMELANMVANDKKCGVVLPDYKKMDIYELTQNLIDRVGDLNNYYIKTDNTAKSIELLTRVYTTLAAFSHSDQPLMFIKLTPSIADLKRRLKESDV